MNNNQFSGLEPPTKPGGKLKFLVIALAPIPAALLILTLGMALAPDSSSSNVISLLIILALAGGACCIVGAIGMLGGFDEGAGAVPVIGGIMLGIMLLLVEAVMTVFLGCAILMIHH